MQDGTASIRSGVSFDVSDKTMFDCYQITHGDGDLDGAMKDDLSLRIPVEHAWSSPSTDGSELRISGA